MPRPRVPAVLAAWALTLPSASGISTYLAASKEPVRLSTLEVLQDRPYRNQPNASHVSLDAGIWPGQGLAQTVWERNRIPGGSSNKTQSEITGVTTNGEGDTGATISAVIFACTGAVAITFLFTILRALFPVVYNRSAEAVQGLDRAWRGLEDRGNGLAACCMRHTDWFWMTLNISREEEVRAAGLDGWGLIEFQRLLRRILVRLAPIVLAVLLPLHYVASRQPGQSQDFLSRFDIANLPDGSGAWWVHAVVVWFVVCLSTYFVRLAHEDFLERRFRWLQELPAPQATTIMVENIPEEYRSDADLKAYFEKIFGEGSVQRAYLVRRSQELQRAVDDFELAKAKLALGEEQWRKAGRPAFLKGNLCGLQKEMKRLSTWVADERTTIEDVCKTGKQKNEGDLAKYCSPSGFVTFKDVLTQRLASGEQYRRDVTEVAVGPAPDPNDVIYDDLMKDPFTNHGRESLGRFWLTTIFLCWSPIVVFISSFTTLTTLEEYVPFVADLCNSSPRFASFLEGVLATAALKLFLAFLPSILLGIIRNFFLLKSEAWAQVRLERWYFSFLTIFVLLVTILGRSIIITTAMLVQKPGQIFHMMAGSLPGASHFYLNYFILGWLQHAWELVRFMNLVHYSVGKVVHRMSDEKAKENSEPEDPANYGMGTRMAFSVLMAAITFVFCSCTPVIMVFAVIYFAIARIVYGYLLVHAETKKPDAGGRFWIEAQKQVFFALFVYVLLMMGVLYAHGGRHPVQRFGPAVLAFLSLFLLFWQWRRLEELAWEFLPLQDLAEATLMPQDTTTGEYIQRELISSVEFEEFPELDDQKMAIAN